jgi:regulator of sigma E protease
MGLITGIPDKRSQQVVQVIEKSEDGRQSEAARIGLRTGDVVAAINGVPLKDGDELINAIQSHPGQKIELTVKRGGETLTMPATPRPEVKDPTAKVKVMVGRLGFEPGFTFKRVGLKESVKVGFRYMGGYFSFLGDLVRNPRLFGKSAGGPVSMLRASNMNSKLDPGYQYNTIGQLSLSLAVFNLLPIPVLDGGHLAILLVELLSGLFWRRRLGPEVHRVATAIGLVFIVGVFLFLFASDVIKWYSGKPL